MPHASDAGRKTAVVRDLLPIMVLVLVAFLVIGIGLPVLPLHVHGGLGFGTFAVGLVTGSQFAASLVSRVWSGRTCDHRGAKIAVLGGLGAVSVAGFVYGLSLVLTASPGASLTVLLLGRAILGGAESFVITGATVWGLGRAGASNAGTVIAWMGTAMFVAFAGSAPIGVAIFAHYGFAGIASVTAMAPLVALGLAMPLHGTRPERAERHGMLAVVGRIWLPGLGAALSSVGFGVILSFASLLFVEHGWEPVWLAFTAYAVALILARLALGHLPDRIGGARVAIACVVIEAVGLGLMGAATSTVVATIGAALVGLGYALVFPALGVEAVKRTPPESRGMAMGAYTACLDLALGLSGPILGAVAGSAGLGVVFLASAVCVLASVPVTLPLLGRRG